MTGLQDSESGKDVERRRLRRSWQRFYGALRCRSAGFENGPSCKVLLLGSMGRIGEKQERCIVSQPERQCDRRRRVSAAEGVSRRADDPSVSPRPRRTRIEMSLRRFQRPVGLLDEMQRNVRIRVLAKFEAKGKQK